MNCCKPELVGTEEHGKMLTRIQVLEDGRIPAQDGKTRRLKDKSGELLGRNIEDC